MIDAPSSLEASSHGSEDIEAPATPQPQTSSAANEPRKCWICFADETEDTDTSSEWVSPCPCVLKAHQSCLLDWIADLDSPKRRKAKKVQCPQCKADIKVSHPHSLSIEIVRALQRIADRCFWPAATTAIGGMTMAGLFAHGVATTWVLLGQRQWEQFVLPSGRFMPIKRALGMSFIPVLLISSRTAFGARILPFGPLLYLALNKHSSARFSYPGSLSLWLCSLPLIRSIYFRAYYQFAQPYENAWLQQLRPQAGEGTGDNDGEVPWREDGDEEREEHGGPMDMDFEVGVQIEVEAVEEEVVEHNHDIHHHHEQDPPHPNNENRQPGEADNPDQANNGNEGENGDNQNRNENQDQAAQPQPQQPPQARQRPHMIQNIVLGIPSLARLSLGALAFPFISFGMGEILRAAIPMRWATPPGYWKPWNKGLLQTRYGRTIVGGCLFVVLKDSLYLYFVYNMAQNHKRRKVLNLGDELKKPWWQNNIYELVSLLRP